MHSIHGKGNGQEKGGEEAKEGGSKEVVVSYNKRKGRAKRGPFSCYSQRPRHTPI
jgi:hypothetical protein